MAIRSRVLAGAMKARVAAVFLSVSACAAGEPVLDMEWTGADTGRATLTVTARHCEDNPLELIAMSGDTGIAIGLFGEGVGKPGTYEIRAPGNVLPRGATLGARWLDSAAVKAYRASGGSVTISAGAPQLAGRFAAEARETGETAPVKISGTFRGVTISGCGG